MPRSHKQFIVLSCNLWISIAALFVSAEFLSSLKKVEKENSLSFLDSLHPDWAPVWSLGQKHVLDDLLFINLVQTFTTAAEPFPEKRKLDLDQLFSSVLKILSLKPELESAYLVPCFAFAFDYKKAEFCEPILSIGMTVFKDNWLFPTILGYLYAVPLGNLNRAAYYYQLASTKNAPAYIGRVATKLFKKAEMKESLEKNDQDDLLKQLLKDSSLR
ncbi:MAG: hypothetical protein KA436_09000 [Oligoflexales bacterium]|nr:hypothetical protein [Oligoflexales bacterium]